MSIRDWPRAVRPREKLLSRGASTLSDAELLALVLGVGTRGKSAVSSASELLETYGGVRGVFESAVQRTIRQMGIGQAKCSVLEAVAELFHRYFDGEFTRGITLTNSLDTCQFLRSKLRCLHRETFACLFLDSRHRILAYEVVVQGTIDSATVHPREIVRLTIKHAAQAVIIAHNHPSGGGAPSKADRALTYRLKDALALIDVQVLDHIIVADSECISFTKLGLL